MRIFVVSALATAVLVPIPAVAQKPAPPPPPTNSSGPTRSGISATNPTEQSQSPGDLVLYVVGRVGTEDGSAVPNDVLIERICNNKVRQQVHASVHGDFSMQLGSKADSFLDASGDQSSQSIKATKDSESGIPRRDLTNCDLKASAPGFRYGVRSLVDLDVFSSTINVGLISVERTTKIEGATVSATPYRAPPDARKAYEKGLDAGRKGKLADAQKHFEDAVKLYPSYASAWYQLGIVLQQQNQKEVARTAYTRATTINPKFLPPYLSLASLAYEERNWTDVLNLTVHILDLDPLNNAGVTGYILDLDPLNCAEAYFFNAVANYNLNRMEEAEKSGLKAERVDLLTRFPELHLVLGEIFARKSNYATAISELKVYLELAPHPPNGDQVREQLAKLEQLDASVSAKEKTERK
jgi:tetratricopeptide (TPR) repeat protein